MNRKHGIGAVTSGSNQWARPHSTQWQKERRDGKLHGMQEPKRSLLGWIWK